MCGTASSIVNKCAAHTNNSIFYCDFLLSCLFFIILCVSSFRCFLEKEEQRAVKFHGHLSGL